MSDLEREEWVGGIRRSSKHDWVETRGGRVEYNSKVGSVFRKWFSIKVFIVLRGWEGRRWRFTPTLGLGGGLGFFFSGLEA